MILNVRRFLAACTAASALTVAIIGGATLPASAQDKAVAPGEIVAKVNGKALTNADIQRAESEIGADLGSLPEQQRRRALVEFLIENQIFADAAEEQKLGAGAGFDGRMQYFRRRALRDAYFDKNVKEQISEGAAKSFYDDQVKGMKPDEEVQARHILVDSEDKAKELAAKVKAGGDFVALAKENSKDPGSKDEGGMLGYFSRGQMVPAFEDAAFALKKGDISAPVKSQFGWHVIKLEDRRPKKLPSFDEVKERILSSMIYRKAQTVAGDLRAKAKVEYIDLEIKKQVEEQDKSADAQKKALEDQIKAQIEAQDKAKGAVDGQKK
ncbi:MAG: peptidylprolyl isomerase [Hyphomicrobium sp.]